MSKFKFYFTINCISFTLLVLLFTILSLLGLATVTAEVILILFIMTACIAIAMFFTDKVMLKKAGLRNLVDLLVIALVVFGIGFGTGFIPMEIAYLFIVLGMILVIYFVTYGIMLIKTMADAESINQRIKEIKAQKKK